MSAARTHLQAGSLHVLPAMLQMTSHPPAHPPNSRHRLPTSAAACSRQEQARQVSAAPGGGDHATMHVVVSCRGKSTRPGSRQAKARATQARWAQQVHLSPASVGRVRVRRAPAFSSESSSRANASSSAVQRSAACGARNGWATCTHAHSVDVGRQPQQQGTHNAQCSCACTKTGGWRTRAAVPVAHLATAALPALPHAPPASPCHHPTRRRCLRATLGGYCRALQPTPAEHMPSIEQE